MLAIQMSNYAPPKDVLLSVKIFWLLLMIMDSGDAVGFNCGYFEICDAVVTDISNHMIGSE